MLRRLLVGLCEGLVIGLALGVGVARGLGLVAPGAIAAIALSGGAGFLIGLIAGRPIWARDAKTEALLKAIAGAVGGAALSFALRRWLNFGVDLSSLSLGSGPAGQLSALTLPAVTTGLALFFELDDDGAHSPTQSRSKPDAKQRIAAHHPPPADAEDSDALGEEVDRELEREKR